jgi:hypothetical protein
LKGEHNFKDLYQKKNVDSKIAKYVLHDSTCEEVLSSTLITNQSDSEEVAMRLTREQDNVFKWLWNNGSLDSKVVLGVPGCGKSYLIRFLRCYLEDAGFKPLVLCPTGIVALNYDVPTLHSFFRMATKSKIGKTQYVVSNLNTWDDAGISQKDVSKLVIIVDECGMISAQIQNCIDQKLKFLNNNDSYMGAIPTFWFGDLFQVEPPKGDWIFEYSLFRRLPAVEMKSSYRHRNSSKLQNFLTLLRQESPDKESISQLVQQLRNHPFNPEYLTLLPTKRAISDFLKTLNSQALFTDYEMIHYYPNMSEEILNKQLIADSGLEEILRLRAGMPIIVIKNFNVGEFPLRNGMFGTIDDLDEDFVHIKLDYYKGKRFSIARFIYVCSTTGCHILQFPIEQAHALTIHKVQSQSLPGINIGLSPLFSPGQAVSGLGRSVSFETISLIGECDINNLTATSTKVHEYYREKRI